MSTEFNPFIAQKVGLFLDRQLNDDEQSNFMEEINQNPHYQQLLDQEQGFRSIVRNSIERKSVSPHLIDKIRENWGLPPV